MPQKKIHILVAPLDWGIGHATRCVPIIRMLLQKGARVTIAAGGQPLAFLKLTFPELDFIASKGMDVVYPEKGSMAMKMALSMPRFISGIFSEHRKLEEIVKEYEVDGVISDNRFGYWSSRVPSIYITHQVMIRMPRGMGLLEPTTFFTHGRFIRNYTECWIPDFEGEENLSGELSHKFRKPSNGYFIGPLTRFHDFIHTSFSANKEDAYDLLAILSGPEPQRSLLEKKISLMAKQRPDLRIAILQGIPGMSGLEETHDRLSVFAHLPDHRIVSLVRNSAVVLCRPGYSTVMDLVSLKKTAVFVPTPGQTEQEYLCRYLSGKGWYHCIRQDELSLDKILSLAGSETVPIPDLHAEGLLEQRIDRLLDRLKS